MLMVDLCVPVSMCSTSNPALSLYHVPAEVVVKYVH